MGFNDIDLIMMDSCNQSFVFKYTATSNRLDVDFEFDVFMYLWKNMLLYAVLFGA